MRLNSRGRRGQNPDAVTGHSEQRHRANRALNGLISQNNCQSSLCIEFVELLMPCWDLLWDGHSKSLSFVFRVQLLYLQGLSLCGQCASSSGRQPDAENNKWKRGYSQGINMCHLDRRVNLSVPHAMCCALSSAPCINFLLSEFKVFVTQCQSLCRFLCLCSGTSPWLLEMLFLLNSTLGHLVDGSRGPLGSGQLTGVPTVATAW